jgi:hypothetical protein
MVGLAGRRIAETPSHVFAAGTEPRAGRPVHGHQGAQSCPRRHEVCQDLASSTWGVNNPLIKLTLTVADVPIRPDRIRRM